MRISKFNLFLIISLLSSSYVFCGGGGGACIAPPNISCTSAINLNVDAPCIFGTTCSGNTPIPTPCNTGMTEGVWYSFIAVSSSMEIEITDVTSTGCDISSAVFSGTCGSLNEIACDASGSIAASDVFALSNLVIGETYFIQVSYDSGSSCVIGGYAEFCISASNTECLQVHFNDTVDCDGNINIMITNCSNLPVYMSYNDFDYFQIGKGVFDYEQNFYNTVVVGQTEWMAQNLKTSLFSNGVEIPQFSGSSGWSSLSSGAWDYYSSDVANDQIYGKLYNWYAVSDNRGICPIGWEVSQIVDWVNLSNIAGGNLNSGGMLKQKGTQNWNLPNTGAVDAYGFEALPGGGKNGSGYWQEGDYAFFWTGTSGSGSNYAQYAMLNNETSELWMADHFKAHGMSIRCINSQNTIAWDTLFLKFPYQGNTSYYFDLFNTENNFIELSIDSNNLIFSDIPVIDAGVDVYMCEGDSVQLNGSGGLYYEWSEGILNDEYVQPLSSSEFIVTGFNEYGCSASDTINIWIYQSPSVNAGVDVFNCFGDSVILSATGSSQVESFVWNNGAYNNGDILYTEIGSTMFSVEVTDLNGCSANDTFTVFTADPAAISDSILFVSSLDDYTLNGITYTESGTYEQVLQNQYGCDSTVILNLNIDDSGVAVLSEFGISVYPNPFSSVLHVEFEHLIPDAKMILTDVHGKVLWQRNVLEFQNVIDLEYLNKGMYYLQLHTNWNKFHQIKLSRL